MFFEDFNRAVSCSFSAPGAALFIGMEHAGCIIVTGMRLKHSLRKNLRTPVITASGHHVLLWVYPRSVRKPGH
jgi:hypothetical protein